MIKFIIGLPYLRHGDEFDSNLLPSFNPSGILLGFPLLLLSMISGQCWGEFRHYLYPEACPPQAGLFMSLSPSGFWFMGQNGVK